MDLVYQGILLLLGVAMILAEMLIPGFGVMGIIGVAVVAAALYFVYDLKGALIGSIILTVTLVFLVVMAVVMRRALSPNGRLGKKGLTLHETSGKNDPNLEPNLVGSTGICRTALRPSGYVQIQGQTYDAIATQGLIQKGAIVVVERVSTNRLYVREAQ